MEYLLGQEPTDFNVAMAPHHGSRHSRPGEFAAWSGAETIVVSASGKRIDEQVMEEWQQLGIEVLRTDQRGAIQVVLGVDGVEVDCWK